MIKRALLCLLVYGLFMLQIYPLLPLADEGIRPDFILILTVYFSVQFPLCAGVLIVFILGCLVEVFSGVNFGLYPLIYLLIFISIQALERFFDFSSSVNLLLLTAFSLVLKFLILLFCFSFIYEYKHFALQGPFVKESAYSLALFPFIYRLLRGLYTTHKEFLAPHEAVASYEHRYR